MNELIHTSSGKTIEIFKDALSYRERQIIYGFVTRSNFRIYEYDHMFTKYKNQTSSPYSQQDIENLGILSIPSVKKILQSYDFTEVTQCRVNAATNSEYDTPHFDNCRYTMLYYANIKWQLEWGGQTLFLNESLNKVEHCSLVEPGKIIVFDGSIPHMIVPPTSYAEDFRLVFVLQFN